MKQRIWFLEYVAVRPGQLRWRITDCEKKDEQITETDYTDDGAALAAALRKLDKDGGRITQMIRRDGSIWLLIN